VEKKLRPTQRTIQTPRKTIRLESPVVLQQMRGMGGKRGERTHCSVFQSLDRDDAKKGEGGKTEERCSVAGLKRGKKDLQNSIRRGLSTTTKREERCFSH